MCVRACVFVCVGVEQRKTIYREECHNYLYSWLFEILGQIFQRFGKIFHLYIHGKYVSVVFDRRQL